MNELPRQRLKARKAILLNVPHLSINLQRYLLQQHIVQQAADVSSADLDAGCFVMWHKEQKALSKAAHSF